MRLSGYADWIKSVGFAENAIDLSVVRDLTEQDLKDLGILLGHRPQDSARDRVAPFPLLAIQAAPGSFFWAA
jgi:hypothetical protein